MIVLVKVVLRRTVVNGLIPGITVHCVKRLSGLNIVLRRTVAIVKFQEINEHCVEL